MTLPLVEELIPPPDPVEVCARFAGLPHLLLLDSAACLDRLGRHSFLCADPWRVIRSDVDSDPLSAVRAVLTPQRAEPVPGLPPFQGGAAGYIGYDWGRTLERLPPPRGDDLQLPALILGVYDWVITWDHSQGRAWIISTGMGDEGRGTSRMRAAKRLAAIRARLAAPSPFANHPSPVPRLPSPAVTSNFTRKRFIAAVQRVRDYILAGDVFQVNLSQRLEAPLAGAPFDLYRRLRRANPAPFAAFLDFGDVVVASASPERFLRVDPSGRVETRPIKGTRPRGSDPTDDTALARELAASEKDRAENVMIVDLLRNDLSRVCRPGTVRVPALCAVESYATVHHLVSTVTGELAPGRDAIDLLRAAFPGGSITGAPKVRAMEIISELEPTARGVYCGAIGYLSVTGAMDTSIVIRTCVVRGGWAYIQVGAGIVADSDPGREYQETLDKARGMIAALEEGEQMPLERQLPSREVL
ncbi:MAG: aminodeoxychorismate synthase component I [Gemmatimonadetes bacterium]|nr:aminodeoxychorismate synthase component I [Gemmatimonadota bacterium]